MPRFSVIVPAYKVQAYLHECLDSVLTQSFTDFELIVVDDCSPDACGEIIDEVAAADSRVTALHLQENVGLGRARNTGMRRATGDYLLFLDSDDSLTPGSLQAIADRLARTGDPDVLVYDYARTYWYGRTARNVRCDLLAQSGPPVFTLAERPSLLMLLMVVWNKVYRRDFVEREGFTFPSGYYEDTPWTYPTLLAAGSIGTLDRVCVHYRQRRQGNILGTTSRNHFDIFEQYDRVFAFVGERPALRCWKPLLYERMVDHLTTVYNTPGRLPPSSRAEFFRRSRAHCRRHLPSAADVAAADVMAADADRAAGGTGAGTGSGPGSRSGGARRSRRGARGRAELRHLLVRAGARRLFQLLLTTNRTRKRLRARAQAAYRTTRESLLRAHYALQRRLPLQRDLAVFAAYWNKGYACNPAAIEAKVRELAPHMRTAWITTPEHAHTLPRGVRRLHPGSAGYWKAMARATYFVNNVNFTGAYVKRQGQIHLQTHHGTPLKHMGVDLQRYPAGANGMHFGKLLERVDRWDFSLSANRHSTITWERAYPSGYTTLEYGYPRNDVLHTATPQDIARVRASLGIPEGATAVLYTPTHRDYQRGYTPRLDLARLSRTLGPDFVVLMRPHYFYREGAEPAGEEDTHIIDVSRHPSVEELCLAADLLVTDYSSIMFDYANLDRPIVIHADDWETYRASRGTYFDLLACPPGLVARTEEELTDILATGAWHSPRSHELRTAFRNRFRSYDDGHAAERVVRRVFLGEDVACPVRGGAARGATVDGAGAVASGGSGTADADGADGTGENPSPDGDSLGAPAL
ncbi:bifunctional glycosyltransferase/CDP-glycerol:glycerophosphate glycerophosphotransferase [Streptomyces daliensis]|uniref:Bifunctional glycosyltransferase family 2 protein/CDP-glycerol:glycerophosphate glycerophosphotransferase n=1 Tax=Streptomyces daliensis TaxID=299421 RepID=A0A8T4IZD7_9ACTN|nr:bifunctional glycosyltransferase family 2 protein/CDP-glycerol:glycerophosphate glycerophosphotransferase [Streptomyces daliensis]